MLQDKRNLGSIGKSNIDVYETCFRQTIDYNTFNQFKYSDYSVYLMPNDFDYLYVTVNKNRTILSKYKGYSVSEFINNYEELNQFPEKIGDFMVCSKECKEEAINFNKIINDSDTIYDCLEKLKSKYNIQTNLTSVEPSLKSLSDLDNNIEILLNNYHRIKFRENDSVQKWFENNLLKQIVEYLQYTLREDFYTYEYYYPQLFVSFKLIDVIKRSEMSDVFIRLFTKLYNMAISDISLHTVGIRKVYTNIFIAMYYPNLMSKHAYHISVNNCNNKSLTECRNYGGYNDPAILGAISKIEMHVKI
jgi:hypothetical protein